MALFSRGRRVPDRAAELHEQLTLLLPWLASLSFEAFAAANQRPNILIEVTDNSSKLHVFRERPRDSNFKFFVSYADEGGAELTAFGECNYLGLIIIAQPGQPVSVCWNTSLPVARRGRDAGILFDELLKFPDYQGGLAELVGSESGVPLTGSLMFRPPRNLAFDDVKSWHPSQTSTMPLARFKDEGVELIGTCFAIHSSGIMLTARHVIDEALGIRDAEYSSLGPESLEHVGIFFWSDVMDVKNNRPYAGFLPIGWVCVHPSLDIAVLKMVLPINEQTGAEVPVRNVTLSPGIPEAGMACIGFGYPRMLGKLNEQLQLIFEQDFKQTSGVIEEIHFPQRDKVFMPFPCFRTSARFDGGMSGGPVISQHGQVCGVICSSYNTQDAQDGYLSYASLIGPALGLRISALAKDGSTLEILISDLVAAGVISVDQTYKELNIIKLGDRQIIDFGQDRYWHYGLSSKRNKLHLLDRFYALKYGNLVKDWHIAAILIGPAILVGLGALVLGYPVAQAGTAAGLTGIALLGILMTAASWLSD